MVGKTLKNTNFSHELLLIGLRKINCPYYGWMIYVAKTVGNSPIVHP